jgi:acyl-CoA oxidase
MAQLIIGGKSYGPHPFVCQIRDMKTHEPLEGIHVGDIGPKFGYNTMDNGFLLLNHVKIPHINMLARFSSVDPETDKYVKPSSPSLVYGTLTWVRSTIVLRSGGVLARGLQSLHDMLQSANNFKIVMIQVTQLLRIRS